MSPYKKGFKILKKTDTERLSELVKDLVETQILLSYEPKKFEELFVLKFEDGVFQVQTTEEAAKLSGSPVIWEKYLRLQALMQCIIIEAQEEHGGLID